MNLGDILKNIWCWLMNLASSYLYLIKSQFIPLKLENGWISLFFSYFFIFVCSDVFMALYAISDKMSKKCFETTGTKGK